MGYIDDKYIQYFARPYTKRSPIINHGTFARYIALQKYIMDFVGRYGGNCQIISLGAGSDTRYFVLMVSWITGI